MPNSLSRRALLVLLGFMLVAWFGTLDYRKLVKPDEGRYAEIPREMLASGDWLTPRLNGIKYFEKPPLQYWATAAAYKTFGLHAWTARLWTALAGCLTVVLVWWAGRRLFGAAAGDFGAMVLASNVYFVVLGHVNTLDMGLTLFTTAALVGFCFAQREEAAPAERRRWMLAAWLAMAFAVLSKGLVGIVLPGATLVLYSVLSRDWSAWRRLCLWPGALVFSVVAAPWFIAVSIVNPEFAWFFFGEQHVLRYATDHGRREGPWYYFLVVIVVGMLPWTLVMADTVWTEARKGVRRTAAERVHLILLCWIATVLLFFTVSRSKLPAYVLPIFPALALLMGRHLALVPEKRIGRLVWPIGALAIGGGVFAAYAPQLVSDPVLRPLAVTYTYWLYAAAALALAGAAYCCWQTMAGRILAGVTGLSASALLSGLVLLNGHDTFAPSLSSYDIAKNLLSVPAEAPFYSVRTYDQTLPFYLRRTFILVEFRDELHFGLLQEPHLTVSDLAEFRRRWNGHSEAYALVTPEHFAALQHEGFAMQLVAQDARRVVVRKP